MARKKQETPMDRLKKIALWQWGLIVISAGIFASVLTTVMAPSGGSTAADRGAAVGRAVVALLSIVVGVILIVLHFVRGTRK